MKMYNSNTCHSQKGRGMEEFTDLKFSRMRVNFKDLIEVGKNDKFYMGDLPFIVGK